MADGGEVIDGFIGIAGAEATRVADLVGDAAVQALGIAGDVGKQLVRLPVKVVTHKPRRTAVVGALAVGGYAAGKSLPGAASATQGAVVAPVVGAVTSPPGMAVMATGAGLVAAGKMYVNHRRDRAQVSADPDLATLRSERRAARPHERRARRAETRATRAKKRQRRATRRFVRRARRIEPWARSNARISPGGEIALQVNDRRARKTMRRMRRHADTANNRQDQARRARNAAAPHRAKAAAARREALLKPPERLPRGRLALRSLGLSKGLFKA